VVDKTITIPIYDFEVRAIVSDNEESFEQDVLDAGYERSTQGAGMIVWESGYKHYTLVICPTAISNGNIAHEALHLVTRMWEDIGGKWEDNNDEPQAYLIGFIVDCLHKVIES
jgi:hypothetical protein